MIPLHDIVVATVAMLGVAFLVCWNAARQNHAALLWGIAHLALAGASWTGYRFMLQPQAWLGLVSTLLTGLFIATLHAAAESLRGRLRSRRVLALRALGIALAVAAVGFGGSQMAGRLLVLALMVLAYGVSARFLLAMGYKAAGMAFAVKALACLAAVAELHTVGTPFQSPLAVVVNGVSSALLGLALIDATIHLSSQRLRNVLRHLPDALVARRLDGKVVFCNERFAQLAGVASPASLVGRSVPLLAADQGEADAIARKVNALAESTPLHEPIRLERSITPAQGAPFPAEVILSSHMDLGYRVILAQIRDLSERKKAEEERLQQANTDQLTGLANRRFLEQQLDALLWAGRHQGTYCAVLLIDLDHFKKVNDTLGHTFGDQVLCETARALLAHLQPGDLLARLSGDEFALVMPRLQSLASVLEVEARAQAILHAVRRDFRHAGMAFKLDASIGVAFPGKEALAASVLLQRAEVAMYEAKARGRSGWCFFDAGMDERLAGSLRIEAALRQAVAQGELRLYYQPIYCARTGRLTKAEALLRWESPQLGWVSPGRFIPVAEESALILEVGAWVLEEAIRQVAQWRAQGWDAPVVSINVSARQFAHPGFEALLHMLLHRHGLPPRAIELELTETLLASDQENLPALLHRLHDAGVGLSLDDFGTGYSSLSYLARFHLNTVKIDRSFVMNLQEGSRNHSLVRAIISMAHSLHLQVVAEGVESALQRAILQAEGCDYLQGYLLGRPMPAEQLQARPLALIGEQAATAPGTH
jgi:diguanylate cyclase (GGDEF)-like protein/PAS domain S-box-containing protein